MITKAEFIDWKNSQVTKEVFIKLQERVEFLKDKLVAHAGQDSIDDAATRGYINAYNDLLLTEYEGEEA